MKSQSVDLFSGPRSGDLMFFERPLWRRGRIIAGIDEAGRGCLAGPVVAAAVILPPDIELPDANDSKLLTDAQRRTLFPAILAGAISVGIGIRSAKRIDASNILEQTKEAMLEAVGKLSMTPDVLLIDGNQQIRTHLTQYPIVKGDQLSLSIAAASIVAKVTRDDIMLRLHRRYACYGWDANKGYGTPGHFEALRVYGPTPLHRFTYRGVSEPEEEWITLAHT